MGFLLALLFNGALQLAVSTASPASTACKPIPGWDRVLADGKLHWIVIGELHGTTETPAIFADAVCLTAAKRGPLIVGLEIPSGDQSRIDSFMNSDGGPAARSEFFKAMIWHMGKDGRSSEAFFRLLDRLRQMHAAGLVTRVVAFQDSHPVSGPPGAGQGPNEKRYAAILHDAAKPGNTVIALVGELHARKTEVDFGQPFMPMAGLLPPDQTLTLNVVGNGGVAWYCTGPSPADCGPYTAGTRRESATRGIIFGPAMDGAYDGILNLGVPTTASPPQPTD